MSKRFITTLFLCCATVYACAQDVTTATAKAISRAEIAKKLDSVFHTKTFRNARWGVVITQAGSTETLYTSEPGKSYVPASNMKLYTTAAAIDILGPDWCWQTRFVGDGPIKNGTLRGNLIMIGNGDPSISGRYQNTETTAILQNIAKQIKAAGIRRISGNLIGDDSYFEEGYAPTWPWADIPEWYSTESGALAVNDNCWDALIYPAAKIGKNATIRPVFPEKGLVTFVSEVVTTVPQKQGGKTTVNISREMNSNTVTLNGEIPVDASPYKEWGSMHHGAQMAVSSMANALRAEGITIAGNCCVLSEMTEAKKQKLKKADELNPVYIHRSPNLAAIIRFINKPSQNFYADMLCRTLDKTQGGDGSWSGCERVVGKWLKNHVGADTYGFVMCDGSGLSRRGMVRPDLTAALLRHLNSATSATVQAFYDSLPIAGVDGTIAARMKNTAAAGNCHAKTGYIGSMRSLSGYVDDKSGRRWIFSMMANNFVAPVSEANAAQDKAVEILANLEGPLVK